MSETGAAVAAEPLTADQKFERLLEVLAQQRASGIDAETLSKLLSENAAAMQKAMKPENADHPGVSVFSHPDGDKAQPKPPMPYELYWNGYPVHKFPETETWAEWLAQMDLPGHGEYTVLKSDGARMKVTIKAEVNADGRATKVMVEHPQTREDKDKIPPKTAVIAMLKRQDDLRGAFLESMQAHLLATFGGR